MKRSITILIRTCAALTLVTVYPSHLAAHCDSLDGPVIKDARRAIDMETITPVLKWIDPADQKEIEDVFQTGLELRTQGEKIQKLADTYLFETLVRIHRSSEGEGFTGLKPAGSASPAIVAADNALADGQVEELAGRIAEAVREAVVQRFRAAYEKKKQAEENVDQGREFVEAYVQFTHFIEGIHHLVSHGADHKHMSENSG